MFKNSEWKKVNFSDVVSINPRESLKKGTLAKKVAMSNITEHTKKIYSYDIEEYKSGPKFRQGDTLFARITPSLENGKTSKVNILEEDELGFASTELIVMREKSGMTDGDFIYYLTRWDGIRGPAIKSMTGTSGRQRVQNSIFDDLLIELPPLEEQKLIANILSSLDDKIENNNAIIANLEEQAQAVFKETLNNYNFTQVKLNTLIDIYSGFAFKSKDYLPGGTHKIITIKNIEDGKINETNVNKIDNIPDNIKDEAFLRIGDIVFSMTGNVGRTALIYKKGLLLNQRVGKILFDNTDYISFYYFLFRNISFKQRLIDLAHGTAQANLGKMDILNLEIPYNKKAMDNFSDIFNPVVNKIINLMRQNDKLIEVRETLLPKLMSGELRVEEAIEVE